MSMRKRKEIQKMLRRLRWLLAAGLSLAAVSAGILPEQLGTARRGPVKEETTADPVLQEYGFDAGEQAAYGPLSVTAWRFKDSTGAMAAFEYSRPVDARPSTQDKLAAASGTITYAVHGNYLFQFQGAKPSDQQYNQLLFHIPRIEQSPLPVISTYLPADGLIPNSERYIVGPVSLEKVAPGIPPSTAAFHLSAEGQYGRYRLKDGREMGITILSYPTPNLARERAAAFQQLPGAIVKRTGSLVVFSINPPSADEAERVMAKINQDVQLTWNENPNQNFNQSLSQMILSIFKLAGIIIGFCLVSGLAFAGLRQMRRRLGPQNADEGMITLHLERK